MSMNKIGAILQMALSDAFLEWTYLCFDSNLE